MSSQTDSVNNPLEIDVCGGEIRLRGNLEGGVRGYGRRVEAINRGAVYNAGVETDCIDTVICCN